MTTVSMSSAWRQDFSTSWIRVCTIIHCTSSHLALSKLVVVGHLSQLTQRGVLPFNQLVQLLGL